MWKVYVFDTTLVSIHKRVNKEFFYEYIHCDNLLKNSTSLVLRLSNSLN